MKFGQFGNKSESTKLGLFSSMKFNDVIDTSKHNELLQFSSWGVYIDGEAFAKRIGPSGLHALSRN